MFIEIEVNVSHKTNIFCLFFWGIDYRPIFTIECHHTDFVPSR